MVLDSQGPSVIRVSAALTLSLSLLRLAAAPSLSPPPGAADPGPGHTASDGCSASAMAIGPCRMVPSDPGLE